MHHTLEPTSDERLFRIVDAYGDWTHYLYRADKGEVVVPSVNHVLNVGLNKGVGFTIWLSQKTQEEQREILSEATNRGTRVHHALHDLMMGKEIEYGVTKYPNDKGEETTLTYDEWVKYILPFVQWHKDHKPKTTIGLEMSVVNVEGEKYAGTLDWGGTIEYNGERIEVLVDYKTSSAIHNSHPLQVAAYAKGRNVHTAILRLGSRHKSGYEFKVWTPDETEKHYKVFQAVYQQYLYQEGEFKPNFSEFPKKIKL